jgi:hypothetical protein
MTTDEIRDEILSYIDMNKKELYEKMIEKYRKEKVNYVMYDLFQYIYKDTEDKDIRKNQQIFREDLIERYNGCIITGVPEIVCQACHIIPFSDCEDKYKYDPDNGLLLRSDLHILFDKGLLKINPQTCEIEFEKKILLDAKMEQYHIYNNKKVSIHKNSISFLEKIFNYKYTSL